MKQIKLLYYRICKRSIMNKCLQSAFDDYKNMLDRIFTNLGQVNCQLSYPELVYIFEKYDWKYFFDALEELENSSSIDLNKPLYQQLILAINLLTEKEIKSKWDNSYFNEFISD